MTNRGANPEREIVDLAQAALPHDAYLEGLLGAVDRYLGVDSALGTFVGDSPGRLVHWKSEGSSLELAERSLRLATTRYADDIQPAFQRAAQVGLCLDVEIFASERARRESLLYREILEPAGVRSMLHICARWRGRPILRLNLNRHGETRFRQAEVEKMHRLLPTLEASVAARGLAGTSSGIFPGLTKRESEIAEYVASGLTTAQIGVALGTSPNTVRNQLTRIFEKLEIDSRAELAAYVARVEAGPKAG